MVHQLTAITFFVVEGTRLCLVDKKAGHFGKVELLLLICKIQSNDFQNKTKQATMLLKKKPKQQQ